MSIRPIPVDRRDQAPSSYDGMRVTVMGLGLFGGGSTVARFLARRGARVTVTDLRSARELAPSLGELEGLDLRFTLGEHRAQDFTGADLVIANPAVSPHSPYLEAARAAGVRISSETALFLELCPARIAAVTGTQGKSSTCNILAQVLASSGFRVHLGGNIGRSLLDEVESMQPSDVVVLEISSYQLEILPELGLDEPGAPRAEVVAVTNVLADHLERHGSVEAYAAAKRRILELACAAHGTAILPAEDPRLATWSAPSVTRVDFFPTRASDRGLNLRGGAFRWDTEEMGRVDDLRLPGIFQRENALVSLGMARVLGADPRLLSGAIAGVRGLPHRLEDLGLFRGRRVWDNGVSTTPDSTISVLESMERPCTLLCGGKAKNLPLDDLLRAARGRVARCVVFGSAAPQFGAAFSDAGFETWQAGSVADAVELAFEHTPPGEDLLFSPACASFDAHLNFKDRASAFREALPGRAARAPELRR